MSQFVAYLSGVNTRKVKVALRPLLGKAPLSRSAVSRIVERLRRRFQEWTKRPLTEEKVVHLYLDGLGVKVRLGGKVVSVPVLAALGVRADGSKVLLALELAGAERDFPEIPMTSAATPCAGSTCGAAARSA